MARYSVLLAATAGLLLSGSASAATCPSVLTPSYSAPVVGSGYSAQLIANSLKTPRGIIFDSSGALLVVESGTGISRLTFTDNGGTCLAVAKKTTVVSDTTLTHGIEISPDGKTLYASSASAAYSWTYDPSAGTATTSSKKTLVSGMNNADHVTRTLLLPKQNPGTLIISRGSSDNLDASAGMLSSGHSQIRAFDLSTLSTAVDYATGGRLLGWGLRNDVGVAQHPTTGGIWSVENSADQLTRNGVDIHQDNPAEELNFIGYMNGTGQGGNYGYPTCFAVWDASIGSLQTGQQFIQTPNSTFDDSTCAAKFIAPRLTFQAHTAPLDIKFTPDGNLAYVTFHGSWDRDVPVGYNLAVVSFANGQPTAPSTSKTAAVNVLSNPDLSQCPGSCFRPVGLALDSQGRIFMSSDSTGEIYVVQAGSGGSASSSTSSSAASATAGLGARSRASGYAGAPTAESWALACLLAALTGIGGFFFAMA